MRQPRDETKEKAMPEGSHYFVIQVPDAGRAREFYSSLFGWSFAIGNAADSHQIDGLMGGMLGGTAAAAIKLYFDVEDIEAAVSSVRKLGGDCDQVEETPSGYQVDCRDDQGTAFSLHQARSARSKRCTETTR